MTEASYLAIIEDAENRGKEQLETVA